MDNKQWPKVRKEAEQQGWTVTNTRSGYQLLSPDGASIVTMDALHASSSPWALKHTARNMKRTGQFRWPPVEKRR
jgi:hypothetical protein